MTPDSAPKNPKYDEAYRMWVIEEKTLAEVRRTVKVTLTTLNRWKQRFGWDGDRVRVREGVKLRTLEAGIDRKASALSSLRGLRKIAEDAINQESTDKVTGVVTPPLRPQKFSEAALAITSSAKEEADILGWKPLPPQVVTVVIYERKRVAEELVRLATSVLLPAVPAKDRRAVGEAFMARLAEIEEQLESPPDFLPLNGGSGMKQAQLVGAPD